jgi:malate dehydrogenase (oxaloacetate-decarboxylating)(NADP+)
MQDVCDVLGMAQDVLTPAAMTALVLPHSTIFVCDTHVTPDPNPAQIADMTVRAAEVVKRFGIQPRAALLSHSNFGSLETDSAAKMRRAVSLVIARAPDLEVDGEMDAESALNVDIRNKAIADSRLSGPANLLVMPTLDAANIAVNLLKETSQTQRVGPILLGMAYAAHILSPSNTVRGIVNMTAVCVVDVLGREAARTAG